MVSLRGNERRPAYGVASARINSGPEWFRNEKARAGRAWLCMGCRTTILKKSIIPSRKFVNHVVCRLFCSLKVVRNPSAPKAPKSRVGASRNWKQQGDATGFRPSQNL